MAARGKTRTGASLWLLWRAGTDDGCTTAHGDGAKCDGRTADAVKVSRRRVGLLPDYLTRKPSRDTFMSFVTLAILFSLTSCLLLGFLSCFYHNQKTISLFISPQRHRLPKLMPPLLPVDGSFWWMSVIILMSDEEIINTASLFSILIILPLNFTWGECRENSNVKEYMEKVFFALTDEGQFRDMMNAVEAFCCPTALDLKKQKLWACAAGSAPADSLPSGRIFWETSPVSRTSIRTRSTI